MRLGTHEIMVLVVSERTFPGNVHFDTTSDTLVSNGTFPGSFHFAANKQFKLFLFRQVSFPVNHGGLQADYYGGSGGVEPPSETKV